MARPAKPTIYSRAQWGANEKMREQSRAELRHREDRLHPPHRERQQLHQGPGARRCCAASTRTTRSPAAGATSATTTSSTGSVASGKAARAASAAPSSVRTPSATTRCPSRCRRSATSTSPSRRRRSSRRTRGCSPGSCRSTTSAPTTRRSRSRALPAGDQRPPRRRSDGLSGPLPLRADPLHPQPCAGDPDRRAEGRRRGTPHRLRRSRRRCPPSPRRPRRRVRRRPSRAITFPKSHEPRRLVVPRPGAEVARQRRHPGSAHGRADRLPRRRRPRKGRWWAMNLLAAVGDVTGDGKGDVLARATSDRHSRGLPRRRTAGTSPRPASAPPRVPDRGQPDRRGGRLERGRARPTC